MRVLQRLEPIRAFLSTEKPREDRIVSSVTVVGNHPLNRTFALCPQWEKFQIDPVQTRLLYDGLLHPYWYLLPGRLLTDQRTGVLYTAVGGQIHFTRYCKSRFPSTCSAAPRLFTNTLHSSPLNTLIPASSSTGQRDVVKPVFYH